MAQPNVASIMNIKLNWKRPLLYCLMPVLFFLVFVGFLPPFPPPRPTRPGQEQSEPAEDSAEKDKS